MKSKDLFTLALVAVVALAIVECWRQSKGMKPILPFLPYLPTTDKPNPGRSAPAATRPA